MKSTTRPTRRRDVSHALLEAVPDLLLRISDDHRFLDFKPAKDFEPYVPPDEFLGKRIDEVLPPEVARLAIRSVERALASGETQVFEYQLPTGSEMRSFEARIVRLGDNEALAIIRDITISRPAELKEPGSRAKELYGLTARELTVLRLVAEGLTDKEVGYRLRISPMTVHKHVARIRHKMNAASRTEVSVRAIVEGLLP